MVLGSSSRGWNRIIVEKPFGEGPAELQIQLSNHIASPVPRGPDLPHRPLPGQRDGPEPHGAEVRHGRGQDQGPRLPPPMHSQPPCAPPLGLPTGSSGPFGTGTTLPASSSPSKSLKLRVVGATRIWDHPVRAQPLSRRWAQAPSHSLQVLHPALGSWTQRFKLGGMRSEQLVRTVVGSLSSAFP